MQIQDTIMNWLLEEDNPPVRYLTLTNLLKKSDTHLEVQQTKAHLMEYEITQGILQHADEFWNESDRSSNWYWKYTNKYWQVIFLGQFLADGNDPRIARGIEDILSHRKWSMKRRWSCFTAMLLTALMRLGYETHPAVVEETEALATQILADGGISCHEMDYSLLSHCFLARPKFLLCFAEIPGEKRSEAVNAAIDLLVQTLLAHEVYRYVPSTRRAWQQVLARRPKRADLPEGHTVKAWIAQQRTVFLASQGLGTGDPKQGWLKFGFPSHYTSDILEAMYALALLDIPMTPHLNRPLQVIQDNMTPEGMWMMDRSLNGKMWVDVEEKGKPSKWITYFALYTLKHFGC